MKSGIYLGMSNEEYHGHKNAVSNSGLGDILQSPFHYYSRHIDNNRPEEKSKPGQLEGSITHCAILEPEEFEKRYKVSPNINRNTNKWKDFVKSCEEERLTAIQQSQYDAAMMIGESARKHSVLQEAFSHGKAEVSAFWTDEETSAACRVRPDFVSEYPGGVVLLDVKTYSDASPKEFARQIARKSYARQDAMYSEGYSIAANVDVLSFLFVAVELDWPHATSVLELDEDSSNVGYLEYRNALNIYAECLLNNYWPTYPQEVISVRLPGWALSITDGEQEIKL